MSQFQNYNKLFIIINIFVLLSININSFYCADIIKSKIVQNNMIVEITSEPLFFHTIKETLESYDEGIFISYDYDEDKNEYEEEYFEEQELDQFINEEENININNKISHRRSEIQELSDEDYVQKEDEVFYYGEDDQNTAFRMEVESQYENYDQDEVTDCAKRVMKKLLAYKMFNQETKVEIRLNKIL